MAQVDRRHRANGELAIADLVGHRFILPFLRINRDRSGVVDTEKAGLVRSYGSLGWSIEREARLDYAGGDVDFHRG